MEDMVVMAGKKEENSMNRENQARDREQILDLVREYYDKYHAGKKEYTKGDRVPYASRVYDSQEMTNLVDSALEFWLTSGRYTQRFEEEFARYLKVRFCSLVNSGSSANLLAFMALTSPLLKDRRIRRGDEVITVAAGFPTTISPIVQYGAVPVFVDVTIPQYNIDVTRLEEAYSGKTKAVMLAHTLGNPFDLKAVKDFCDRHGLWLIEDNCDALGSEYTLDGKTFLTGTVGDIGTSSFYPPHHMTMGEGGAVYTDNPLLHKCIRSFRDWGRDCSCPPGRDGLCGHRYDRQYGQLPAGYDHKYVYSHFGYNLKATDLQASIGCAQLEKFPSFVERRKENFAYLRQLLEDAENNFILPKACENSSPSWFGFLLTCREGTERSRVVPYVEEHGVQTRMLFAGNLVKHPCFDELRDLGSGYRVVGSLENTDRIMRDTFWVGVYPGMTRDMLEYMAETIKEAARD
jgi:CDP-6-deoxy-D-xylo-4-hexulose-3-dehydrase